MHGQIKRTTYMQDRVTRVVGNIHKAAIASGVLLLEYICFPSGCYTECVSHSPNSMCGFYWESGWLLTVATLNYVVATLNYVLSNFPRVICSATHLERCLRIFPLRRLHSMTYSFIVRLHFSGNNRPIKYNRLRENWDALVFEYVGNVQLIINF